MIILIQASNCNHFNFPYNNISEPNGMSNRPWRCFFSYLFQSTSAELVNVTKWHKGRGVWHQFWAAVSSSAIPVESKKISKTEYLVSSIRGHGTSCRHLSYLSALLPSKSLVSWLDFSLFSMESPSSFGSPLCPNYPFLYSFVLKMQDFHLSFL